MHAFSNALSEDARCCNGLEVEMLSLWLFPGQKVDAVKGPSLDERETAYFAARQRIFSGYACDSKQGKERPKKDPEVARRMITRALGQADKGTKHEFASNDTEECGQMVVEDVKIKYTDSSNKMETNSVSGKNPRASTTTSKVCKSEMMDGWTKEAQQENNSNYLAEVKKESPGSNHIRQEHMGAAKRLFANALRNCPRDVNLSKTHESKETGC